MFTVVILSLLFFSCSNKNVEVIKIGAILPLTGNASFIGEQHKTGMDFAVKIINEKWQKANESKRLEIIYEDDSADPKKTINSFNKLVNFDNVKIVITVMSSPSMALIPLLDKNKVVLIANCGHPTITTESEWVFRNFPTSGQEVELMMNYLEKKKIINSISVLYINDSYGESAKEEIVKLAKNVKMKVLSVDNYDKASLDYKNSLTKIISLKPEAIYVFGYGDPTVQIIKQLAELKYKGLLIGSYNFSGAPISTLCLKEIENSLFTAPEYDLLNTNEKLELFKKEYYESNKKEPLWNTVVEFDAVNLILKVCEKTNICNGDSLKNAFSTMGDFNGLAGEYKRNNKREWVINLIPKTVKNGIITIAE